MIDALKRHLAGRKSIAPILDILKEKKEDDSETALKILCVLDYFTEKNGFYEQIPFDQHPKLLQQLMTIHSYKRFKYFHYRLRRSLEKVVGHRLLLCKYCDLLAPYATILDHTATSHNVGYGSKECAYCNRVDLLDSAHSIEKCYRNYLLKNAIDEKSVVDTSEFFSMLREIAAKLGVLITRTEIYGGIGKGKARGKQEYVTCKIPEFPTTCTVYKQTHTTKKKVNENNLDIMFEEMVKNIYGGNGLSRMLDNKTAPLDPVNSNI